MIGRASTNNNGSLRLKTSLTGYMPTATNSAPSIDQETSGCNDARSHGHPALSRSTPHSGRPPAGSHGLLLRYPCSDTRESSTPISFSTIVTRLSTSSTPHLLGGTFSLSGPSTEPWHAPIPRLNQRTPLVPGPRTLLLWQGAHQLMLASSSEINGRGARWRAARSASAASGQRNSPSRTAAPRCRGSRRPSPRPTAHPRPEARNDIRRESRDRRPWRRSTPPVPAQHRRDVSTSSMKYLKMSP